MRATPFNTQDADLQRDAAVLLLNRLQRPKLPELLIQVACWTLGEYGSLVPQADMAAPQVRLSPRRVCRELDACVIKPQPLLLVQVMDAIVTAVDATTTATTGLAVSALLKLAMQVGSSAAAAAASGCGYPGRPHPSVDPFQTSLATCAVTQRSHTFGSRVCQEVGRC